MNICKKLLALTLAAVMVFSMLPLTALASEPTPSEPTPTEAVAPTETTAATEATETPTESTEAPTEATETPTESTEAPTEATETPTESTEAATEATEAPTESTEAPTEATEPTPSEPTAQEVFNGMVSALPAPGALDASNEAMMLQLHNDVTAIIAYALENNLYTTQEEVLAHPTIAAIYNSLTETGSEAPTGTITQACMSTVTDTRTRLTGDLTVTHTGQKLMIKLYSGQTMIATSELVNSAHINKANQTLSWNFVIAGEPSSSWTTTWAAGHPNKFSQPDKVVLNIDGVDVANAGVTMNANNDLAGTQYNWSQFCPSTGSAYLTMNQGANDSGRVAVWGETIRLRDPKTSFKVELYSGNTLMATTLLAQDVVNADTPSLSWHVHLDGPVDTAWSTTLAVPTNQYTLDAAPTSVKIYSDGVLIDEVNIIPHEANLTKWEDIVAKLNPGAKIDETGYANLQHAIDNAGNDDVITLLRNETVQNPEDGKPGTMIHVPSGKNVVIDLNGNTVIGAFFVNGTATIKNGTITNAASVSAIESEGNLTVEDLNVSTNRHGLRISGGTATINRGIYQTVGTGTMHALNISNASVTVKDGAFIGAASNGGTEATAAVNVQGGVTLSIEKGSFSNAVGGVVTITSTATSSFVTISGGNFVAGTQSIVKKDAPAASVTISGGTYDKEPDYTMIAENKAATKQGNVYVIVDAVAKIGNRNYGTVQDAVTAATAGQTVTLLANSEESLTLDTADVAKTITLDINGKELSNAITFANEESTLTIKDSAAAAGTINTTLATAEATRENYTVVWYTDPDTKASVSNKVTSATEAGVTYAHYWKPDEFILKFYSVPNGAPDADTAGPVAYGAALPAAPVYSRDGYTQNGWKGGDGKPMTLPATMPAHDLTIYANWVPNAYTIKYDKNDTAATGTMAATSATYDAEAVLAENAFVKDGYRVIGWATEEDKTTVAYELGEKVKNLTAVNGGEVTLYAVWEEKQYFTVDLGFDPGIGGTVPADQQFAAGDVFTVPEFKGVVPSGYMFIGWQLEFVENFRMRRSTAEPAVGGYYQPGETFLMPNHPIKLTARIIEAEEITVKVVWNDKYNSHKRPGSVKLNVTTDGKDQFVVEVDGKNNNWTTYLAMPRGPKHDVTEQVPAGYEATYSIVKDGYKTTVTITNTPKKVLYVYNGDKLTQTGEITWPIPMLALAGISVMAAGMWMLMRKKETHER